MFWFYDDENTTFCMELLIEGEKSTKLAFISNGNVLIFGVLRKTAW